MINVEVNSLKVINDSYLDTMVQRELKILDLNKEITSLKDEIERIKTKVLPLYEISHGKYMGIFKKLRNKMEDHK